MANDDWCLGLATIIFNNEVHICLEVPQSPYNIGSYNILLQNPHLNTTIKITIFLQSYESSTAFLLRRLYDLSCITVQLDKILISGHIGWVQIPFMRVSFNRFEVIIVQFNDLGASGVGHCFCHLFEEDIFQVDWCVIWRWLTGHNYLRRS